MTREEKAKAYDKALEKAKIWKNKSGMPKDKQGILDDIFPALKESEDERIRKALIQFTNENEYKATNYQGEYVTKEQMLAWLEKQREQKFTDNKEKLNLLKFIRKETSCGLAEANNALLKLIKVLKQHPFPIMDKPHKLKIEWEE